MTLFVFATAGCVERGAIADDHANSTPLKTVRRAADVLVAAGTSRVRTSMEMASGGTRVTVRGRGGFDYLRGIGHLTVRLPRDLASAERRKPIIEVLSPGVLYMKNRGAGVPADKWVSIRTADLADGNLVSSGVTDPISAAELLRGARRVAYAGKREWGNVMVRHYWGRTDLRKAAESASPYARQQLVAAQKGLSTALIPFDVYVDGQGRLRRVTHQFMVAGMGAGSAPQKAGDGIAVDSTTTLYGFGAPVNVEMPKPDDIYTGRIASPQAHGDV